MTSAASEKRASLIDRRELQKPGPALSARVPALSKVPVAAKNLWSLTWAVALGGFSATDASVAKVAETLLLVFRTKVHGLAEQPAASAVPAEKPTKSDPGTLRPSSLTSEPAMYWDGQ